MKRVVIALFAALSLSCVAWAPAVSAAPVAAVAKAAGTINLNQASAAQLQSLPGIGKVTAEHIISYRSEKGPFHQVEDLLQVKGVGPKTLEKIRGLVTLE